jgi:hypothetical protein
MQFPASAAQDRETETGLAGLLPRAFAAFLVLHGLVHLAGFVNRSVGADSGDIAVRTIGLAWLAATVAFVVLGVMLWRGHPWARRATIALLLGSLVLCAMALPNAILGLAIDVVLLALLAVAPDRLIVRRPN